ncbi:MAG: hypothetical protein WBK48_00970 [Dethiobacteria bacterium]|nr:hypothetical protein [Bacillota bacterium]NLM23980.1 hypothetical protein [Bacillota bacterium]
MIELFHQAIPFVFADEVKITQLFYNLLLNAITHSGHGKAVLVRQTVKEDRCASR